MIPHAASTRPLRHAITAERGDVRSRHMMPNTATTTSAVGTTTSATSSCRDTRLASQRLHQGLGGLSAREVLLPGDQVAVTNREAAPPPGPHVVGSDLPHLVLDPPRHHVLVAGQEVHGPYRVISEVLLDVGEPGHRFACGEIPPVGELRVSENRDAMAERAGQFAGLEELHELPL